MGTQRWEGDWPGKACGGVCLGGCTGAACAAGRCLVAGSYLAGVDVALRVASAQVVGVDVPCVPPATVAEVDVDEVDLGLLQDIC